MNINTSILELTELFSKATIYREIKWSQVNVGDYVKRYGKVTYVQLMGKGKDRYMVVGFKDKTKDTIIPYEKMDTYVSVK